ncbi:MAG: DUF1800 domain-containing protein [Phycisphaerae bacterium]|jgi:uncharacterized protein (DUF1800 family)
MSDWLAPYEPSADTPWNRRAAAHLLRRAGFCSGEDELREALDAGPQATVARLFDAEERSARCRELDALGEALAARGDVGALRGWWLLRMRHTSRPLHARMTVFWHNHFATSFDKVRDARMMAQQLGTLERHALGKFEPLLLAMAQDPAMIVWLDGQQNVKGRPNENFARELFELFTLGVGNYTERDIREAARGFTGWQQRGGRFHFARAEHDGGEKSVFGRSGPFGGEDVVRLTVAQPACATFVATKLLREFVCPEPPDDLIDALAKRLVENGCDVRDALQTLLLSRAMFDRRWYRARIKSPVELVVGLARSLNLQVPAQRFESAVAQMGQRLLEPPSVKGWDGHRAWLNSATMLVRLNAAARAVDPELGFDPAALRTKLDLGTRERVIAFCGNLALDGDVPDVLRASLAGLNGELDDLLRSGLRLLLSSPEYQMA